jgi:hypothetical protein
MATIVHLRLFAMQESAETGLNTQKATKLRQCAVKVLPERAN